MYPPIIPVVCLSSVKDMRLLARVLQSFPGLPLLRVRSVNRGNLCFFANCDRASSFETDLQRLMKVSSVNVSGHPHLSPLSQLEQMVVLLTQAALLRKQSLLRKTLPANFIPYRFEVTHLGAQQIFHIFYSDDDFSEQWQGAMSREHIFRKCHNFLREGRRVVLKVLEGYGPEDGLESGHAVNPHLEAVPAHRKLLLKTGALVCSGRTDQKVGHISNMYVCMYHALCRTNGYIQYILIKIHPAVTHPPPYQNILVWKPAFFCWGKNGAADVYFRQVNILNMGYIVTGNKIKGFEIILFNKNGVEGMLVMSETVCRECQQ